MVIEGYKLLHLSEKSCKICYNIVLTFKIYYQYHYNQVYMRLFANGNVCCLPNQQILAVKVVSFGKLLNIRACQACISFLDNFLSQLLSTNVA